MRLLGRGGADPLSPGRQVQRHRRAAGPRPAPGYQGLLELADHPPIKDFSSWPTIPQLYVKGEFVGGCDIVREMAETGELEQLFTEKGVASQTVA
jgi:hypothetical protein